MIKQKIDFHKLHGLGNDFMLLDGREGPAIPCADSILAWSDRRTGVGFDQLIYLHGKDDQLHYRFFNGDGTEAEQCGNGQRALALYLKKSGWASWPVTVNGKGGPVELDYKSDDAIHATLHVKPTVEAHGNGVAVDVGNPHWIRRQDSIDAVDWESYQDQADGLFPLGVNIEVVRQISDDALRIRIHERGVGETQACGSGACAAAWAGHTLWGMGSQINVKMPGGELTIVCDVNRDRITLIGAAKYVYQGEIES